MAMVTLYCNEQEGQDKDAKDMIGNSLFDGTKIGSTPLELMTPILQEQIFGEGTTMDSGVFFLTSRINHSCCPNAWYDFNPHTSNRQPRIEMLTTHAICDIAAGEQILLGYDAVSLKLREKRTEELASMDAYNCDNSVCALCTDPLVEASQQRAYTLWQAADYWARPWP
ncbi:hypothetical protein N0V93_002485 [Gnomoniopsis smithogilvyi]|uniref:SET domain-containing protein n=1 Tax=Gnomoniopsis smithogilvyi TaxID=1191159 RepID=A0A9W8YYQ2_9PEZI|nr:hypothetical protein N0V93_002485 [Gnomoniopsis smithogilvyi]